MPEVDHASLVASLVDGYDGWALSTSAKALRDVLPLCPPATRVCAWVKPGGTSPLTFGVHNQWEPVLVMPARSERPGRRDWLRAMPARREGSLPGRKPQAFCAWLFDLLGLRVGDEFADLFPGTGIVSRAWSSISLDAGTHVTTRRTAAGATVVCPCPVGEAPPSARVVADVDVLEERRRPPRSPTPGDDGTSPMERCDARGSGAAVAVPASAAVRSGKARDELPK